MANLGTLAFPMPPLSCGTPTRAASHLSLSPCALTWPLPLRPTWGRRPPHFRHVSIPPSSLPLWPHLPRKAPQHQARGGRPRSRLAAAAAGSAGQGGIELSGEEEEAGSGVGVLFGLETLKRVVGSNARIGKPWEAPSLSPSPEGRPSLPLSLKQTQGHWHQEPATEEDAHKAQVGATWLSLVHPSSGTPDWAHGRNVTLFSLALALALALPLSLFSHPPPALADTIPALSPELLDLPLAPSASSDPSSDAQSPAPVPRQAPHLETKSAYSGDTTVTERVYLDFSLCPTGVRLDRVLGDTSRICSDGEPLGRVVLGLYGNQVPVTVQHFVDMVTGKAGSTYKGSIIHRLLPGQYIMAGHQGAPESGDVRPPSALERNPETVQASSFLLGHQRPGTVSLALAENDDEGEIKERSSYRNVEFLITTGPGPATQLDSRNVVFGTVLQGFDVIREITTVPTYSPSDQIRQFNDLAVLLGDERAAKGRSRWNQPLKAIVISDCGVLSPPPTPPPLLPPSLP